jgi:hypothetical protein
VSVLLGVRIERHPLTVPRDGLLLIKRGELLHTKLRKHPYPFCAGLRSGMRTSFRAFVCWRGGLWRGPVAWLASRHGQRSQPVRLAQPHPPSRYPTTSLWGTQIRRRNTCAGHPMDRAPQQTHRTTATIFDTRRRSYARRMAERIMRIAEERTPRRRRSPDADTGRVCCRHRAGWWCPG